MILYIPKPLFSMCALINEIRIHQFFGTASDLKYWGSIKEKKKKK